MFVFFEKIRKGEDLIVRSCV